MGNNYSSELSDTTTTGNSGKFSYCVDIAMCIDATGSMRNLLDMVKNNALNFYSDVTKAMAEKGKYVDELRVRLVVFRDYLADGEDAMLLSPFYSLPQESAEFENLVRSLSHFGGGDDPEDGLEALAYAIKSKWTTGGSKRRHVIVVWTDASTHAIGFGRSAANYPAKMPQDFDELTEWWGDKYQPGVMDNSAKRLVLFAPDAPYWSTISDTWDNTLHFPSQAGGGLQEMEYRQILDTIVSTI